MRTPRLAGHRDAHLLRDVRAEGHHAVVALPIATLPDEQRVRREEAEQLALRNVARGKQAVAVQRAGAHGAAGEAQVLDARRHEVAAGLRLVHLARRPVVRPHVSEHRPDVLHREILRLPGS
jgi:hypothetical protein